MSVSVWIAGRSASWLSIVSAVVTIRRSCRCVVVAIFVSGNSRAIWWHVAEFRVFGPSRGGLLLASESEALLLAIALGVIVRWAWAVALLLLVMAHEHDLHDGRANEEQRGDDGDGEGSRVESAGEPKVDRTILLGGPGAERGGDDAFA